MCHPRLIVLVQIPDPDFVDEASAEDVTPGMSAGGKTMDDLGPRRSSRPRARTPVAPQQTSATNRGKKDLPPEAAQVLKDWMLNHFHNPYPTPTVRIMPAHIARMSLYLCTATSRWRVQALTHCHSPFPLPHATYTATYTAAPPPPLCLRAWMQLSTAWL